jgi:chaperonin GroES
MPIKPIKNFILVKPALSEDISEGGIIVPDNCKERSCKAGVVSVGRGTPDKPMFVKPGDTIWNIKDAGQEIEENGELFFLITTDDILGYLPKN